MKKLAISGIRKINAVKTVRFKKTVLVINKNVFANLVMKECKESAVKNVLKTNFTLEEDVGTLHAEME